MARALALSLCGALCFSAPTAVAQDDDDDAPAAAPEKPKAKSDADDLPDVAADEAPLPPPGPPRAGEQEPGTYFAPPVQPGTRRASIGPDLFVTHRGSSGEGSYGAGPGYGAHLRAELTSFLGLRAHFSRVTHDVELPEGALGLPGTRYDQPAVTVTTLGGRLEPTLWLLPTLYVWAGAGVSWGRLVAPIPSTSGALDLTTAERTGVLLEWTGAIGGSVDVIAQRLAITAWVSGGIISNRSGVAFATAQAIDQNGQTVTVDALPEPDSVLSGVVGVEAVF